MKIIFLIAKRFFFAHPKKLVPKYTIALSLVGIMLAVASNVMVLGLLDGAKEYVYQKALHFGPHIYIFWSDKTKKTDQIKLEKKLKKNPNIDVSSLFYATKAKIKKNKKSQEMTIFAFENDSVYDYFKKIMFIGQIRPYKNEVVVGRSSLKWFRANQKTRLLINQDTLAVSCRGAIEIGNSIQDQTTLLIDKNIMKKYQKESIGQYIWLKNPMVASQVAQTLKSKKWKTKTWIALNASLFSSLKIQSWVAQIWLFLSGMMATLFLIIPLIIIVKTKEKEWGVLMALGMTKKQLMGIVWIMSIGLSTLGLTAGILTGLMGLKLTNPVLKYFLKITNQETILDQLYLTKKLPILIDPMKIIIIIIIGIGMACIMSLWPIYHLRKTDPLKAMKQR